MTDEQINEIVQINETIRNSYLNAIERTDADREYRQTQKNIAHWLEELVRLKEKEHLQKAEIEQLKIVAGGLEQALNSVSSEADRLLKECNSKEDAYNKEFFLRKELKSENESLKGEIKDLRHKISYMTSPNTIGDRHEMGGMVMNDGKN